MHGCIFASLKKMSDKYACNSHLPMNELSWPTPSLAPQTVSMATVKRIFTMQLILTVPAVVVLAILDYLHSPRCQLAP